MSEQGFGLTPPQLRGFFDLLRDELDAGITPTMGGELKPVLEKIRDMEILGAEADMIQLPPENRHPRDELTRHGQEMQIRKKWR